MTKCVCMCIFQPSGRTFPMLEGPNNQDSSVEDEQECVITPSTTVKFSAALKERNRINFMRNSLLLIGAAYCTLKKTCTQSCGNHATMSHSCPLVETFYSSCKISPLHSQLYDTKTNCHNVEKCGVVESCKLHIC